MQRCSAEQAKPSGRPWRIVRTTASIVFVGCGSGGGQPSHDAGGSDATTGADAGFVDSSADASGNAVSTDAAADASLPDGVAQADAANDGGIHFSLGLSDANVVSTYEKRAALGFRFGYADGVLGAIARPDGGYVFFASGRSAKADAGTCTGDAATPDTQGSYRIGVSPEDITENFGCRALISNADVVIDGGLTGPFDRDYVGAGPVLSLTRGTARALVMIYHAEFHWGPTCNNAPCFYGTLGMAASLDDGATFTKVGEIVQPALSRPDWISAHPMGDLSIGAGPYVLGDAQGHPVDPVGADPATTFVYVFYVDYDTTNAAPCNATQCVGVARASMQDVMDTAFGSPGAKAATRLFSKYYAGTSPDGFGSPAASGSTDDTTAGGHYTAVLSATYEASLVYDRTIREAILAYKTNGSDDILIRTSANLLRWPDAEIASVRMTEDGGDRYPSLIGDLPDPEVGGAQPFLFYTNSVSFWPSSTFMNRRIIVTVTP